MYTQLCINQSCFWGILMFNSNLWTRAYL